MTTLPDTLLTTPGLQRIFQLLDRDGEQARMVGGAVRNALMGLPIADIDIATTALPDEVMRRAAAAGLRALPTGIEHGTVTLLVDHKPFEVTTLREDIDTDGRRATVRFGRDFAHDAQRRDFTMNALYARADGTVEDHVGGLTDLARRHVRFIGDAHQRIREDYLRILRLFRFHAAYGEGALDKDALHAAIELRDGLDRLSRERIRAEMMKLLVAKGVAETMTVMRDDGFLDHILGGVAHVEAMARIPQQDSVVRLGALALETGDDVERLRDRLRLSNAEAARLAAIARALDHFHTGPIAMPEACRFAWQHGGEAAQDAALVLAARDPSRGTKPLHDAARLRPERSPFSGADLIARGLTPGPRLGQIIARAESEWALRGFPAETDAILAAAMAATP
jgi:poly(A) polymerase